MCTIFPKGHDQKPLKKKKTQEVWCVCGGDVPITSERAPCGTLPQRCLLSVCETDRQTGRGVSRFMSLASTVISPSEG